MPVTNRPLPQAQAQTSEASVVKKTSDPQFLTASQKNETRKEEESEYDEEYDEEEEVQEPAKKK